jgi:hypothetical protein
MKMRPLHTPPFTFHVSRFTRRQSGSAVIVIMALLSILLLYMAYNLRTLANLGRELRLLERQQTHRLQAAAPKTNAPPTLTITTNLPPSRSN